MTTTVASVGTLASQPVKAKVYYSFEVSTNNHDMIVFRSAGVDNLALRDLRDRTKRYLSRKLNGFKSSMVPVRQDKLGRQCVYTDVPVYGVRLSPQIKAELVTHFANNGLVEWVNTETTAPVQAPTPTKDKVIAHVGKPDYTKKRIDRTQVINDYLKQPIGELTQLCQQRNINPSWSKVSMASLLADYDIRHGQVQRQPIADEALLATEPEELPSVPVTVEPPQRRLLPDFSQMTKAQLLKLAGQNGVALKRSMPKSEMITRLIESVQ